MQLRGRGVVMTIRRQIKAARKLVASLIIASNCIGGCYLAETARSEVISCARAELDSFRASAQSLQSDTSKKGHRLQACSSYTDEVAFWLGFYGALALPKATQAAGLPTSSTSLTSATPATKSGVKGPKSQDAAEDLRAARELARAESWSEARIRYDSYLSKRPGDHQIRVERVYTIIWERKFFDAEKQFDELLKTALPPMFVGEAERGKNLAASRSQIAAPPENKVRPQTWVATPEFSMRDGSDTLRTAGVRLRTERRLESTPGDQLRFDMSGVRVGSQSIGPQSRNFVAGLSAGGRIAFGDHYQLDSEMGYFGVLQGVFAGHIHSKFKIPYETGFTVGIRRTPLLLSVPLQERDFGVTRDSIFAECSWASVFESRYTVSREGTLALHERLDVTLRWPLREGANVVFHAGEDHHPRPSPYYSTQERVRILKGGYELILKDLTGPGSKISLNAGAGTAFTQSRYPQGKDAQVGLWDLAARFDIRWSELISGHFQAQYLGSAQDVNEEILRRKATISASLDWVL